MFKCANQHQTGDCEEGNAMECANCQLNHNANDPFCETYLNHAPKVYKQRNIPIPSLLQTKIDSVIWNGISAFIHAAKLFGIVKHETNCTRKIHRRHETRLYITRRNQTKDFA